MSFNTVDEILDFAIEREQKAHEFYLDLASKMERPGMSDVFAQFAREELGHKKKLESIKQGKRLLPAEKKVLDLKIGDYLVEVDADQDLDYQRALILAMKREKKSYKLYEDIANRCDDQELKQTFQALAQEEAKHKLRFEVEYDEVIFREN